MRLITVLLALFLLLSCVTLWAGAEDALSALSEETDPEAGLSQEILRQIGPYDGAVEGFGQRFLKLLLNTLGNLKELGLREGLRTLGLILAAALFCALLEENDRTKAAVPLVGALSVAAACTQSMGSMIALGTQTIQALYRYTSLLLPAMTTLMTASGNPSAAALSGFGIVLFDLLLSLISGLLIPLLYLFLVLTVAESALELQQLSQLRCFVKWLLVSAVKGIMWGYSGILSLTGLVSNTLDAQKLRSMRAAIAGMVPVVGNLVSEASASLLSAAALLRTGTGLYGMLAVLGICLGPSFQIGLQYLLLKLAAALCGLFGKGSQAPLLERLSEAMGLVLALTGIACLLCLMILVLFIRTVTP